MKICKWLFDGYLRCENDNSRGVWWVVHPSRHYFCLTRSRPWVMDNPFGLVPEYSGVVEIGEDYGEKPVTIIPPSEFMKENIKFINLPPQLFGDGYEDV